MTRYVLSEDADRDLDGIWDYIAEDNLDAADQWIGRLFDAFDAIARIFVPTISRSIEPHDVVG
jgi:plasmid stabilization system protein ParE